MLLRSGQQEALLEADLLDGGAEARLREAQHHRRYTYPAHNRPPASGKKMAGLAWPCGMCEPGEEHLPMYRSRSRPTAVRDHLRAPRARSRGEGEGPRLALTACEVLARRSGVGRDREGRRAGEHPPPDLGSRYRDRGVAICTGSGPKRQGVRLLSPPSRTRPSRFLPRFCPASVSRSFGLSRLSVDTSPPTSAPPFSTGLVPQGCLTGCPPCRPGPPVRPPSRHAPRPPFPLPRRPARCRR